MTPTEGNGTSQAAKGAQGPTRKTLAAVARRLYVGPFTKLSETAGLSPKTVLLWYFFLVLVVGVPAAALFLKRGLPASLHDGEAFLFSLALTLGVLYDHAKQSFEKKEKINEAFADVRRSQTLGYVVLNLGALVVSTYYIVTSTDSGAVHGIPAGRLAWFVVTVFVAIGLPLIALLPAGEAASAAQKREDGLATRPAVPASPEPRPGGGAHE